MQLFGTIEVDGCQRKAMLCVDDDARDEWMLHIWSDTTERLAVLCDAHSEGGATRLIPKLVFKQAPGLSMHLPALSEEEIDSAKRTWALLRDVGGQLKGEWGREEVLGEIILRPAAERRVAAEVLGNWQEFLAWADRVRREHDAVLFRGHGDSEFKLRTSLHRTGRTRMERFCDDLLPRFRARAEVELSMRLKTENPDDYSLLLGLAQHHGLPTPLLDWTESPYIAAFFAFADALDSQASRPNASYVRVYGLTRAFTNATSPPQVSLSQVVSFVSSLQISPLHNPRLLAQQGRFLVTNVADLESFLLNGQDESQQTLLLAADLPISLAKSALEELAYMGLHAGNLFPGLDGVCKMLRHQMFFNRRPMQRPATPLDGEIREPAETPRKPQHGNNDEPVNKSEGWQKRE